MTSEALNVPVDKVRIISADTGETRDSGSVSASRMTFMAGNSVIGAAEQALEKWHDEERPAIATYQYLAPKTTKFDPETGASTPNFAYGYVAQAVELIVDTETGQINIEKIFSAHDVGKAINPTQLVGQIEGGVIQALGLENPDPNGPFGALGVAEMPYISLAPAVTAAVHDATGIWFDEFPLTPERILRGLGKI
jgi:CO/xanthine dehydrogenase Mo-binding subunit